jgi:hypothetical protein
MKRYAYCLKPVGLVEYKQWRNFVPKLTCGAIAENASRKTRYLISLRGLSSPGVHHRNRTSFSAHCYRVPVGWP